MVDILINEFYIYRVSGLIDNHDYEFRVAAVNAAGQGPWSASSDMIRCCAPPSKNSILLMTGNSFEDEKHSKLKILV